MDAPQAADLRAPDRSGNDLAATPAALWPLLLCGGVMEAAYLAPWLGRSAAGRMTAILAASVVANGAFVWLILQLRRGRWSMSGQSPFLLVVGAAVVFRLTLLGLPPTSSDDVYRYLWEGVVQRYGFNPYATPPDSGAMDAIPRAYQHLRTELNHPEWPAIYPSFAQALFRLNAVLFDGSLLGWKLVLLLFEAALAAAVLAELNAHNMSPMWLAAILWCPLLVLETYEGAHLDLAGVAMVAWSIVAARRGRWALAAVTLALAFNVKYPWPGLTAMVLWPQLRSQRRMLPFAIVFVATAAMCWVPYWRGTAEAVRTLQGFVQQFRFNSLGLWVLGRIPGPPWLAPALGALALLGLAVALARRPNRRIWEDASLLCGAGLVVAPNVFPWYLLWVVPAIGFRGSAWILAWVVTAPVLHVVKLKQYQTGTWDSMLWLCVLVDLPGFVLLATQWYRRVAGAYPSKAMYECMARSLGDSTA